MGHVCCRHRLRQSIEVGTARLCTITTLIGIPVTEHKCRWCLATMGQRRKQTFTITVIYIAKMIFYTETNSLSFRMVTRIQWDRLSETWLQLELITVFRNPRPPNLTTTSHTRLVRTRDWGENVWLLEHEQRSLDSSSLLAPAFDQVLTPSTGELTYRHILRTFSFSLSLHVRGTTYLLVAWHPRQTFDRVYKINCIGVLKLEDTERTTSLPSVRVSCSCVFSAAPTAVSPLEGTS